MKPYKSPLATAMLKATRAASKLLKIITALQKRPQTRLIAQMVAKAHGRNWRC